MKFVVIYWRIYSKRNILFLIFVVWIVVIVLVMVVFLFGIKVFCFYFGKNFCFVNMNYYKGILIYIFVVYGVVCFLVFFLMLFCYFKVYWRVWVYFVEILNLSFVWEVLGFFVDEVRIIWMLFVILIVFFVCWILVICMDVYEVLSGLCLFLW